MIIAIDAGNSRIKWGVHDGSAWIGQGALPTGEAGSLAEVSAGWPADACVVACSVAGIAVEDAIEAALAGRISRPLWVRPGTFACGVSNGYEQPGRLGADRWAALVGARHLVSGACLVVCAGTATTVDPLDAGGNFPGGLILPGLDMMLDSLAKNTAQLPLADGEFRREPRNTRDAIVTGCLQAQAGAIERMFSGLAAAPGAVCLMTGGAAHRIAPCLNIPCRIVETLILDGLLQFGQARQA